MAPRGGTGDREAILARRALFLASTLVGLGSAKTAHADEPDAGASTENPAPPEEEACPAPVNPDPETLQAARTLTQEGIAMLKRGEHEDALTRLRKAYELYPVPKLLLFLGTAERFAGDPAGALKHLRLFVRCAPDDTKIDDGKKLVAELENEVAKLTVQGGAAGTEIRLDGVTIGRLPLAQPLVLNPGQHQISVVRPDCEPKEMRMQLAQGEQRTLVVETECVPPMPCLSPIPCLEPIVPRGRDDDPRFGVGVAPQLLVGFVPEDERKPGFAARFEAFYLVPLGEPMAIRLGLVAMPGTMAGETLIPIGLDLEAMLVLDRFRVGIGASGGYVLSSASRSDNDAHAPVSSAFVYPYVIPMSARVTDNLEFGMQIGVLISKQSSQSGDRRAPTWFASGLFVRYLFGSPYHRDPDASARLPLPARLD